MTICTLTKWLFWHRLSQMEFVAGRNVHRSVRDVPQVPEHTQRIAPVWFKADTYNITFLHCQLYAVLLL